MLSTGEQKEGAGEGERRNEGDRGRGGIRGDSKGYRET